MFLRMQLSGGGIPAKIIRYRFDENIIKKLSNIDYQYLNENYVKENVEFFYKEIDSICDNELDKALNDLCNK